MTMSQMLLPEFDNEMKLTRKTLERVPDDKFDWKPHAKSMSMGRLAGHLAELPGFGTAVITTDGIDFDKGEYKPAVVNNRADVLELFDKNVAATREAIVGATDDHLRQPWHLIYKEKKIFEAPPRGLAGDGDEPHCASSGAIDRVSAVERCGGAFDLGAVGGRDVKIRRIFCL